MLRVAQPTTSAFHNLKCGEIFCISPAIYNVSCCLCATKIHLDQFPTHFQMQHIALAEESINLEELERKRSAKLAKDASLLDNMTLKEEDPEDDPIKEEDLQADVDKGDTNLQKLLRDPGKDRIKVENEQETVILEPKADKLSIWEKLEVEIVMKKPNTRSSRKSQNKANILEKDKKSQNNILHELSALSDGQTEKEIELELDTNVELEEFDNDDMDKDWPPEDKLSNTDSDPEDTNNPKDELPFPCHTCRRSYRSKHSLRKHNYSFHNPNKPPKKTKEPKTEHKCDLCDAIFRSDRHLRGHKWKHTGICCDICGKTFTQPGNLVRHKKRHTGIKTHKCEECDKEFFTDKELKSHIICHTGLMPLICELCGKQCRDRGVLKAHMRRHTGERPAKCDVCGKSFFSFHDLNVHAVTHSSERPFKCDICASTFQRKKALRVHKLIHSKDRKHVCKICEKSFAQSGGLKSHMRTHDAALEKSTMLDQSSSHSENHSTLSTTKISDNNDLCMPAESNMLAQYIV